VAESTQSCEKGRYRTYSESVCLQKLEPTHIPKMCAFVGRRKRGSSRRMFSGNMFGGDVDKKEEGNVF
jgi:hypothetical protein